MIGRAPRQCGLWLAYGHGHWGLTLGPATGRLIAEMMTGATPFCDPEPYGAERFTPLRSCAVRVAGDSGAGNVTYSLIVLTTLDSGRVLLLDENLSCALTMSSYFASVVTGCFGTMCTTL